MEKYNAEKDIASHIKKVFGINHRRITSLDVNFKTISNRRNSKISQSFNNSAFSSSFTSNHDNSWKLNRVVMRFVMCTITILIPTGQTRSLVAFNSAAMQYFIDDKAADRAQVEMTRYLQLCTLFCFRDTGQIQNDHAPSRNHQTNPLLP